MFKNSLLSIKLIILAILPIACVTYVGIDHLEDSLNALIGTNYSTNTKLTGGKWSRIFESNTHFELEQRLHTGCYYAILINKNSDSVESWRFTSERSVCEEKIYVPGA